MSLFKTNEQIAAKMDDENETFYSFERSSPDTFENLSDIENMTIRNEQRYELEKDATILSPVPKSHFKNHYLVQQSTPYSKMPDELFEMNVQTSPKLNTEYPLDTSPDTTAMHKWAFTEIWIEGQQTNHPPKRSPICGFTNALDDYFEEDNSDQFAKLSLKEQQKSNINQELFESSKSTSARSASSRTASENEPYVSPFEYMPKAPEKKPIPGQKPYVMVPAGFDLTNLVEYKNPNHWHRRLTTRNEDFP